jgi:hypothetical protein
LTESAMHETSDHPQRSKLWNICCLEEADETQFQAP